jgi:hypothetical protein
VAEGGDVIAVASREQADREKRKAALSSVLAAIFLTLMKLVVGLLTGSLGILAEALHSGLDLVAAGVTLFAVQVSGRPADREHPYGHGKVENLSALFETLLLLATCVWIIYEALQRLFVKSVEVEASFWAFAVMIIAIAVERQPVADAVSCRKKVRQPGVGGGRAPLFDGHLVFLGGDCGTRAGKAVRGVGPALAGECGRDRRHGRCRHCGLGQPAPGRSHGDGAVGRRTGFARDDVVRGASRRG